MSDTYIDPFVKSLALGSKIQILNLSRTALSSENSIKVFDNLPYSLLELNVSHNEEIGPAGITFFSEHVINHPKHLLLNNVNFESCSVLNDGAQSICHAINIGSNNVTILNLSNNKIDYKGGKILGEFIRDNKNLFSLILHGNCFGGWGGEYIAKGLQINNNLTVVDLSMCSLGGKQPHLPNPNKQKVDENGEIIPDKIKMPS